MTEVIEMPEVEDKEYTTSFTVDFSQYTDAQKFDLIEHIVHGDTEDIEGTAHVILEFDMADYPLER